MSQQLEALMRWKAEIDEMLHQHQVDAVGDSSSPHRCGAMEHWVFDVYNDDDDDDDDNNNNDIMMMMHSILLFFFWLCGQAMYMLSLNIDQIVLMYIFFIFLMIIAMDQ